MSMAALNFPDDVRRKQDLLKIDIQLRDAKDLLITCPPLSGLTAFLKQIKKYIYVSEHFKCFTVLFYDCQVQNASNNIIEGLIDCVNSEIPHNDPGNGQPIKKKQNLFDFFTSITTEDEMQKRVVVIDNLDKISEKEAGLLLENIRVIAEYRNRNQYLRNVLFVLAGHSLDLRRLDPKHSSPFNTATQIYLDDLPIDDSVSLIKEFLADKKYSPLVPNYIDYLTFGHPYLIRQICYYVTREEVQIGLSGEIKFEAVDSVVETICNDKREQVFKQIDNTIKQRSPQAMETLERILNGFVYKSVKSSDSLRELKLCGLINNNRNNKWHIRNNVFDFYLRSLGNWSQVSKITNFIPRRLFVNLEGYKILFDLENNLREFVIAQLFDAFGDNWQRVIEQNSNISGMVKNWKKMQQKDMSSSWLSHDDIPSLAFGSFPEIKKIIYEYWGGVFDKYFQPKTIFEGSFESLEILRNKIAHNRPLSDKDVETLSSITKQFNDCMFENHL